ncbi:MAG: DNA alkylation repair protein [Acidobacteriota bacterium]
MVAKPGSLLDPVADLEQRLARRGRGSLRTIVHRWWHDHGLAAHPAAVGKRVAMVLLERRVADHQRAGMIVLEQLLADHLRASDLPAFARLLDAGHVTDWELVDRFAIEVLGTLLHRVRGRAEAARALATWRIADTAWQRRAACVAFTALAPQGDAALAELSQLVFAICGTVLWSPERADQTAAGWLLCELSRAEPARVDVFFRRHARLMSRECARAAVERYAADKQRELLAHHRRATSFR